MSRAPPPRPPPRPAAVDKPKLPPRPPPRRHKPRMSVLQRHVIATQVVREDWVLTLPTTLLLARGTPLAAVPQHIKAHKNDLVLRWLVLRGDRLQLHKFKHDQPYREIPLRNMKVVLERMPPDSTTEGFALRLDAFVFVLGSEFELSKWFSALGNVVRGQPPPAAPMFQPSPSAATQKRLPSGDEVGGGGGGGRGRGRAVAQAAENNHDNENEPGSKLKKSNSRKFIRIDRNAAMAASQRLGSQHHVQQVNHFYWAEEDVGSPLPHEEYKQQVYSIASEQAKAMFCRTDAALQGYLLLMGEKTKRWSNRDQILRYFVLHKTEPVLQYFFSKRDEEPEGEILLHNASIVRRPTDPFTFSVCRRSTSPLAGLPPALMANNGGAGNNNNDNSGNVRAQRFPSAAPSRSGKSQHNANAEYRPVSRSVAARGSVIWAASELLAMEKEEQDEEGGDAVDSDEGVLDVYVMQASSVSDVDAWVRLLQRRVAMLADERKQQQQQQRRY